MMPTLAVRVTWRVSVTPAWAERVFLKYSPAWIAWKTDAGNA